MSIKRQLVSFSFLSVLAVSTLWAMEQPPSPKVLSSGQSNATLAEQLAATQPEVAKEVVQVKPVDYLMQKPSDQFVNDVQKLDSDINNLFKKVTSKVSSMSEGQIAVMYLEIKSAQQRNILLEQQNQIMDEIALLNANIKALIEQNNEKMKETIKN